MSLKLIKKNNMLVGLYQTIIASQEKFMAEQIKLIFYELYGKRIPFFLQKDQIYLDFHDYLITGITRKVLFDPHLICPSCWKSGGFKLKKKKKEKEKPFYYLFCKYCNYKYHFNYLDEDMNDFITFVLSNLDSLIHIQEFKDVIKKYYLSRLQKDTKGII